jgi:uncharacterized damage-inducible protein DinB
MPHASDALLDALLDSWNRNHAILVNLLRLIPDEAMSLRPSPGSPSIAQLFTHIHYCRLVFVQEDAPEAAQPVPDGEWRAEADRGVLEALLDQSAAVVREAVRGRVQSDRPMDRHYDHPILLLQHHIWHEGYHHGQIKLTLKQAGRPLSDDEAGLVTWDLWMDKGRWTGHQPRTPGA